MSLDHRFPTIADLRRAARWRIPRYLWGYLEGGAGNEGAARRTEDVLDRITLSLGLLAGEPEPDLSTEFLGRRYDLPVGIAPVGMSGAVWPDAEALLARTGAAKNVPYALSTVAAAAPEAVGPKADGTGWFQLYAPSTPEIRQDILRRAKEAGFHTLVFTIDVPVLSRRPRELRQKLENPMKITPRILLQSAIAYPWALGMLGRPIPRPVIFDPYLDQARQGKEHKHVGLALRATPDRAYLQALRDEWDGPLIVKGVLEPEHAAGLIEDGADAIWVSNHGGRQFEAAAAPIARLPLIREAVGPDYPLICDGAVRSGTDVLRMIAMGADFVFLGRAFHYGLAAAGRAGAEHVLHILAEEMRIDMAQMGIDRPAEARGRAHPV